LATAYISMKRYDDAERMLEEILESNANDADTLANMVTLLQHTGRSAEASQKWLAKLRHVSPNHPYVKQLDVVSGMFDRVASSFAV
jgi:tetratricopeptide (TPR) repeat protein